ncbi:MAG: hypothetical protein WBG13_28880, partial [Pseudolabrys sp.]
GIGAVGPETAVVAAAIPGEPACFPVPVFGGLGGNELNCSVNSQRNREVLIGGWRDWRCGSPRPVQKRHPR